MPSTATAVPLPSPDIAPKPARQRHEKPCTACRRLRPAGHFDDLEPLADTLNARVLGEEQATEALISSLSRLLFGLCDPSRSLLRALLLGPTGVGKTETACALAHGLLGDDRSLIRINCEEFTHSHEIAKLLSLPPCYVEQERPGGNVLGHLDFVVRLVRSTPDTDFLKLPAPGVTVL